MNQGLRLILAFGLSMVIMFLYSTHIAPPLPSQTQPNVTTLEDNTEPTLNSQTDQPAVETTTAAVTDKAETKAEEKLITIETDVAQILLTNKGAKVLDFKLKKYKDGIKKDSKLTQLVQEGRDSALFLGLEGYSGFDENRIFEITNDTTNRDNHRIIELTWQNSEVRIVKTFTFNALPSPYGVKVDYAVSNVSGNALELSTYFENRLRQKPKPQDTGGFLSFLKTQQPDIFNRVFFMDKSLTTAVNWDDFAKPEMTTGAIHWTGLSDRYFIVAMGTAELPPHPVTARFERRTDDLLNRFNVAAKPILKAGEVVSGSLLAYIGPKELGQLESLNIKLEQAVDYGWFSILAVPILWLMTFLHGFIPNWGLVIIALTFIVKVALHPVNKKSMQSMKAMQLLQPKLAEIKKRYPDDREKQNQETMQLFRTHKVNPAGGCLPMLLQMPIYIVLYKVLWNAIELYHAPFFWIYQDLSAPDPYFILPILLGVFMFLQQKLTPAASADPAQQRMMMFMPIMFTGFMLFLPVGLVVYIFVNTAMSVVQQFMIKNDLSLKQIVTGKWQANGA